MYMYMHVFGVQSPYPEQPGQEWGREKQTLMDEAYVKFSTAKAPVQGEDCLECVNTCRRYGHVYNWASGSEPT